MREGSTEGAYAPYVCVVCLNGKGGNPSEMKQNETTLLVHPAYADSGQSRKVGDALYMLVGCSQCFVKHGINGVVGAKQRRR